MPSSGILILHCVKTISLDAIDFHVNLYGKRSNAGKFRKSTFFVAPNFFDMFINSCENKYLCLYEHFGYVFKSLKSLVVYLFDNLVAIKYLRLHLLRFL